MRLGFRIVCTLLVASLIWGVDAAVVQASGSHVLFAIPERDLYPESVAYDPTSGDYFVSSMAHSRILRVHADGTYDDFVQGDAPGLQSSIGMKADAERRRLWVCTGRYTLFGGADDEPARTGVLLFDLDRGTLIKKWLLDQPGPAHIFNDLVVAENGDVYATTTLFGKVYRISAASDDMEVILDTPDRHNNGISLGPGERYLFVTLDRTINRLDLKTGKLIKVSVPDDGGTGTDGLYFYDGSLISVRPRFKQVARLFLNEKLDDVDRVEVLADRSDDLVYPTTGVVVGDSFVFVATSYADVPRNPASVNQHEDVIIRTVPLRGGPMPFVTDPRAIRSGMHELP